MSEEQRRYLIAIGSPSGGDGFTTDLNYVKGDVQRVVDLFANQEQGYQRVLQDIIPLRSSSDKIKTALTSWFSSKERRTSDCVIVYYAGHGGGEGQEDSHYLSTSDSLIENLQGTAIETSDLVKWFFAGSNEYPQNVLLILDVCSAGLGAKQIIANLTRGGTNTTSNGFWIFCSSTGVDTADDGAFVQALEAVIKEHEWENENFLSLITLKDEINDHLKKVPQVAEISVISNINPDRFIRNPNFIESKKGEIITLESSSSLTKVVRRIPNSFYIPRKSCKRFVDAIKAEITTLEVKHFIFHAYGIGGIGKSTFLRKIQEELGDIAIFLDCSFEDSKMDSPLNLMKFLHSKLILQDKNKDPFLYLLKKYATTKKRLLTEPCGEISEVSIGQVSLFNEYESNHREKIDSLCSETSAETLGNVNPSLLSVKDRFVTLLSQHPATRDQADDQDLLLNPLPKLIEAFLESLSQCSQAYFIVMDTYEKANSEFHDFFDDLISSPLFQKSRIRILMAGRYPLSHQRYRKFFKKHNDENHFCEFEFGHFDKEETECFLRGIGISKPHETNRIWKITKGYPYHLNLIKRQVDQGRGVNLGRESNDMVDLILDGLTSTEKEIVSLVAYVRWFDQPTIQYLLDEVWKKSDGPNYFDWFDWLIQRDFIVCGSNHYRFDDVTRDIVRRSEFKKNQNKFRSTHEAISTYFSQLAEDKISSETLIVDKYNNSDWKELTSEVVYHALFSNRDRGKVQFLTHFFEGAYFRQPEIAMRVLLTISSEAEPESNELLPQDTRRFVGDKEKIEYAVMLGWLVVGQRPKSYEFKFENNTTDENDDNNSQGSRHKETTESKIESGLDIFFDQFERLSGIARYFACIGQSLRCTSHRSSGNYISKAQEVVDRITGDSNDSILASNLLEGIGSSWYNIDEYEKAYDGFNAASNLNLESVHIHNMKGVTLNKLGRYDEAIHSFDEAISINPDEQMSYLGRGTAYINSDRSENAISSIEKAIEIDSTHSEAHRMKGLALMNLGQFDKAVESLDESIRLNSKNSVSYCFKSIALWMLSSHEEAMKTIERAISLDPGNSEFAHQKMKFLMSLRKYEESLTEAEKVLRINPRDPDILCVKSLCLSLTRCHDQALDTIKKAISTGSHSEPFLLVVNQGIILARSGKYLEAVSICNSVIETHSSSEVGHYGIACCYALQGDYSMALDSLQEAINIDPKRCRDEASTNPDFDRLRDDERFILMTTERTPTS